MVLPEEHKEPLGGEKVGFPFGEWKEPPNGEKVGSLGRIVSPEETLRLGMMMSLGIGCSTARTKECRFLR
jgi:hypothetical protein